MVFRLPSYFPPVTQSEREATMCQTGYTIREEKEVRMEAAEGQRTTVGPLSSRGGRNATSRRPRGEAVGWMGWQDDGPGRMGQDGRTGWT